MNEAIRRRSIVACISVTMTVTITLGLAWPLLAIVLERQGVPVWLNGLSASAQMVAVLAVMPVAPALIGALGVVRVVAAGVAGMAICLALLPAFPNVWAWFPIRFGLGLTEELVLIAGDIWINQLARDETRGRLIGVYGTFILSGFALGPLAIIVLGSESWAALYLGIAVVILGLVPLAAARSAAPALAEKPRARLRHWLRLAKALMVAGLLFGLIGSSVESLLAVYGLEKGLDENAAALLLTLYVVGQVAGQLPSGWLADRFANSQRLLAAGSLVALCALAAVPLVMGRPLLRGTAMLALGASVGSFYIVAMTMMGRRYQGADLIGVNTSFVFVWGLGATLGPGLSGWAMADLGPDGMPLMGALLCGVFLVVCLRASARAEAVGVGSERRPRRGTPEQPDRAARQPECRAAGGDDPAGSGPARPRSG